MQPIAGVVLTTIGEPSVLEAYWENFDRYGHLDQVLVVVIPDRKTPASVYQSCASLADRGLRVFCPTLEEQETFLGKLGAFTRLVPYDSDNRRNVGFLMALEKGVDFLISIDDDNFCLPSCDFFAEHSVVCQPASDFVAVEGEHGWLNVCEMLELEPDYRVYPRGFPYHSRNGNHQPRSWKTAKRSGLIRLNAGLWLSEPDLDGLTWLVAPVRAKSLRAGPFVLGESVWSPINSQNTAIHREAVYSYYFVRMGYPIGGPTIDRYGDIFSGYFAEACLKHLGHFIRVGTPLVEHRRNSHNYLADATRELPCVCLLEDLTLWLREVRLCGGNYAETYISLASATEDIVETFKGPIWTDSTRGYFHQMAYCMRQWVKACQRTSGAR